jgi:uncharacterized LabA/DUF88 family protein
MERISIFIDGGNFYHLVLKKLGLDELKFDFEKFASFLANQRSICERGKRFYVGTVREKVGDPRTKFAMSKQTKLFNQLKHTKWEIKTSKLKTRVERIVIDNRVEDYRRIRKAGIKEIKIERLREKGIDVKLATDLIVGAIDNQYDTAVIVSSDSDLIPAIDWVRHRTKKRVEYIGFSILDKSDARDNTTPLLSMISRTDIQRALVEADIVPFITQP